MWRSGAPQRRAARGAFRGAEAHTRRYEKCHEDREQIFSIAILIARDPPHKELAQSKGEKAGYAKGTELARSPSNTSTGRPALTPHLKSVIARGQAILEELQ